VHYPAKALDVSNYQRRVDWRRVARDGFRFAAIKATEGTGFVDPYVARNVHGARKNGIAPVLYHFAHPSNSPRAEARHFLRTALPLVRVGEPCPALDLEVTEGKTPYQLWEWQHTFSLIVEEALGGHVILYTYRAFLESELWLPRHHRPIWGADYGSVPASVLSTWHAWQYTSSGSVSGVRGACDLNSILKPLPTIRRKRK
jgi:GH25 family lysozyme M1 (1,4-beta-N-acetylmuramidase)